jgi:hypothetical protein
VLSGYAAAQGWILENVKDPFMGTSIRNKALLFAIKAGYTVSPCGTLLKNNIKHNVVSFRGYLQLAVSFKDGDVRKDVYVSVHRLQAYQLFGDKIFKKGIVCRHLNSNKIDNSVFNIKIGTDADNARDNSPEHRLKYAINAASKIRRYPDEIMLQINSDRKHGMSYNKLREKYGIAKSTLSYMFNDARYNGLVPRNYKQVGFD